MKCDPPFADTDLIDDQGSLDAEPTAVVTDKHETDRRSQYDRRRGPGRRRTDDRRAAEDGHMNEEQLEFIKAMEEYKRANSRPFPTWTEILDILRYLGYRRVAPVGEFKLVKGRQTPVRTKTTP